MSVASFMEFSSGRDEVGTSSRPPTRDLAKPSFGCSGLRSSTTSSSQSRTTSTAGGSSTVGRSPLARSFDEDFDDKPYFKGGTSTSGGKTVNDFINFNSKDDNRGPSAGATVDKFIGYGGGGSGYAGSTAGMSPGKRATHRKLAREVYSRIKRYLEDNDIHFAGASDETLQRIEDAWSIAHPDPRMRRANAETLRGVSEILREYPSIHCVVHGETGQARTAPVPLASYLRLDPQRDMLKCMDFLAEKRALACFEELVRLGIPREQLDLTFKGNGTKAQVDFIPSDMADDEPPPPPPPPSNDPKLEREIQRLRAENSELRAQQRSSGDYQKLQAAYEKLSAELSQHKSLLASFEQRVRAEVARRVQVEVDAERRRHEEELRRLRLDVERLEEENRRLRHDLNTRPTPTVAAPARPSLDLVDILPAGLELSSLKRAEWRRLFERIVAELLKRKKTVVQEAPVQRYPAYDTYKYDVKSKVDSLWASSSSHRYRPPPPPVPPPPPPAYRGGDAEQFIAFSGGTSRKDEAERFIEFSGGRGSAASDYLSMTKAGSSTGGLASDASGFLEFSRRKAS